MTVYIVHWKNMVDTGFLEKFINIGRALGYALGKQNAHTAVREVFAALDVDDKMHYIETVGHMRVCGYAEDGRTVRWFGWLKPYISREERELCFFTDAPEGRTYISRDQWWKWKGDYEKKMKDSDEAEERAREKFRLSDVWTPPANAPGPIGPVILEASL